MSTFRGGILEGRAIDERKIGNYGGDECVGTVVKVQYSRLIRCLDSKA